MTSPPDFTCPNGHRIPEQRFDQAIGCVVMSCTYRGSRAEPEPVELELHAPEAEPDPPPRRRSEGEDRLRNYVGRWENLIEARKEIAADLRELRVQAESDGFPSRVLAELIRRRAMDPRLRETLDSLLPLYEEVVGLEAGVIDGGTIGAAALPPPAPAIGRAAKANREILSAELARMARQDGF